MDATTLLNALLTFTQAAQTALRQALHALGLTGDVHGQPAWPFAWRVAAETLLIDRGLTRHLALFLAAAVLALMTIVIGALWRRARWPLWLAAVVLLLIAPKPSPSVVLTDAVPTSFHRSPSNFDASSIDRGLALYAQHSASCHGTDGRGEGPAAASLAVWPPTLSAGLLWKRAEGELLWRVLHGMQARDGKQSMPGFADRLTEADAWAVLDGMKALSAGEGARRQASWPWPVRAPGIEVRCDGGPPRALSDWRGQRVRIVTESAIAGVNAGSDAPVVARANADKTSLSSWREDPRVVTIALRPEHAASENGCEAASPAAWRVYASVAGLEGQALAGTQFIVGRDGWLRALGTAGQADWSEDNLICRSDESASKSSSSKLEADGLGALIARMDADPVRAPQLGLPHSPAATRSP